MKQVSSKICVILILVLITLLFSACEDLNSSKLEYEINVDGETCTITGLGTCTDVNINIPQVLDGYTVTAISPHAFADSEIKSIRLPDTITKIGRNAFSGCTKLQSINIPSGVSVIEDYTFENCLELKEILLPEGITKINQSAFNDCENLLEVVIPSTVQVIGIGAFGGCIRLNNLVISDGVLKIDSDAFVMCHSLTEVYIPASVKDITTNPFSYCVSLQKIFVDENNLGYSSIDGVLYNKDCTKLIGYPAGRQDNTFDIPDSVNTIYILPFLGSEYLKEINIPQSVKTLFPGIISYCPNLNIINYDGSVAEWNRIQKYPQWTSGMNENIVIKCTDGQISKDGTVTYN